MGGKGEGNGGGEAKEGESSKDASGVACKFGGGVDGAVAGMGTACCR